MRATLTAQNGLSQPRRIIIRTSARLFSKSVTIPSEPDSAVRVADSRVDLSGCARFVRVPINVAQNDVDARMTIRFADLNRARQRDALRDFGRRAHPYITAALLLIVIIQVLA